MRSPEGIAAEAMDCKKAGDHDGYGHHLRELESHGFNAYERALLLSGKDLDEVLKTSTVNRGITHAMCD
jgi:hypothetical protein